MGKKGPLGASYVEIYWPHAWDFATNLFPYSNWFWPLKTVLTPDRCIKWAAVKFDQFFALNFSIHIDRMLFPHPKALKTF